MKVGVLPVGQPRVVQHNSQHVGHGCCHADAHGVEKAREMRSCWKFFHGVCEEVETRAFRGWGRQDLNEPVRGHLGEADLDDMLACCVHTLMTVRMRG
jgi:hypothetical protein